jgi:hypothetical protein
VNSKTWNVTKIGFELTDYDEEVDQLISKIQIEINRKIQLANLRVTNEIFSDYKDDLVTLYRAIVFTGKQTWKKFCKENFSNLGRTLTPKVRKELAKDFHNGGLSQSAIADLLWVDNSTISRDLEIGSNVHSLANSNKQTTVGADGRILREKEERDQLAEVLWEAVDSGQTIKEAAAMLGIPKSTAAELIKERREERAKSLKRQIAAVEDEDRKAGRIQAVKETEEVKLQAKKFDRADAVISQLSGYARLFVETFEDRELTHDQHEKAIAALDMMMGVIAKNFSSAEPDNVIKINRA